MKKLHITLLNNGPLSRKESVVLVYLCHGFTNKEIAKKEGVSDSTIGKQVESIAFKLESHSKSEIVSTAIAMGLVKSVIHFEHSLFIKCMSLLLIMNFTGGHIDMRRGPQAPRPARTLRTAGRTGRQNNRFIKGYEDESTKPSHCFTWPQCNNRGTRVA